MAISSHIRDHLANELVVDTLEREALAAATSLEPRIEMGVGKAAVL